MDGLASPPLATDRGDRLAVRCEHDSQRPIPVAAESVQRLARDHIKNADLLFFPVGDSKEFAIVRQSDTLEHTPRYPNAVTQFASRGFPNTDRAILAGGGHQGAVPGEANPGRPGRLPLGPVQFLARVRINEADKLTVCRRVG